MRAMSRCLSAFFPLLLALLLGLAPTPGRAQSEALSTASALPLASAVAIGSGAAAGFSAVAELPLALAESGAELVVVGVQASADGSVYLLRRASDGAEASIAFSREVAGGISLATGDVLVSTTLAAGTLLSLAGEALAFIPNAFGETLLHHERVAN
jgi:hypothetical protein